MLKTAAIIILTALIFVYDLLTPHGMAVSLLYLIPFSLSGLFTRRKFALAFAGVTTALVIAGYFLASAPIFPITSEINRALTILTGWGILAALIHRNKILHQLYETNARLQAIFDCSPNAMVALDSDGKVLAWSKGAQKIFGYEPQEVMGRPYPLLDGDAGDLKKLMASYLEGNRTMAEVIRKRKDGTRIPTLLSTTPLKDAGGQVIGVLGILVDLTEKKRAEADIDKANAMLKAVFDCATDMLIENRLEDKKEALNLIRHGSEKILGMVEDYLTVYRSHAVKLALQLKPEEIVDILRGCEKDFHALAEKKDIRLNFAFADSPKAVIDKKQFSRAVSNLVENAIKFSPRGGPITLSVEASERDFTVSVSDTGPGIMPGEQDNIFQKHYRSSMAKGTKGAGLGLAIAKAIAEAHGGKITFENNPGAGSTFKLTIPLRQEITA